MKFLRILGWWLIVSWVLTCIPYLLIILPSRYTEAPWLGGGQFIGYFVYLALGIWLVRRKGKEEGVRNGR